MVNKPILKHNLGDKFEYNGQEITVIRVYDRDECFPYVYLVRNNNGKIFVCPEIVHNKSNLPSIPLDKYNCIHCTSLLKNNCSISNQEIINPDKYYCSNIGTHYKE